ncbi:MAG TPA: futalosine hydrolase [Nitrospirota bacterium]|nr:futalosine hydrolase [Nitrospirota bacterium]
MIALLCAVQAEAEHILAAVSASESKTVGSKSIITGTLAGQQITVCVGGMGKVNAAHAATLLAQNKPEALVIFGVGGAYPSSGAKIGDIALAKEEIAGDEGVLTLDGFKDTEFIGIPLIKTATSVIYTTYPATEAPLQHAIKTLVSRQQAIARDVHIGTFVTLSTCTGTSDRARDLESRYHGLCENMEGAAAAQVAELHGIPWIEVRGISNIVEDRNFRKWDIPRGTLAAQQAVRLIVEGWVS